MPWPSGLLGSREEAASVEVCCELREDEFSMTFDKQKEKRKKEKKKEKKKRKKRRRKIGDGPVVFQIILSFFF